MNKVLVCAALTIVAGGGISSAHADITLSPLFSDAMVLQRNIPLRVWGNAAPGEKVLVTFAAKSAQTVTQNDGHWHVSLPAFSAGGPYELVVSGKNTLTRKNILVGDVWLCSGQSNMQFSLQRASTGAQAIAASADSRLRLFKVGFAQPIAPTDDVRSSNSWQSASPQTTGAFSAVGYFFGRALRKAENIPIGLIASDWGGTTAQAWTREAVLSADPNLKQRYIDTYPMLQAEHDRAMATYTAAAEKAKTEGKKEPQKPYSVWRYSGLYNGMIAPLTPFPLRGVVWYQGESNAKDPEGYRTLLPAMIRDWRIQWNQPTLPFLLVQLPAFGSKGNGDLAWARMREIQEETARHLPNVGIAVTIDVGDQHNIHPINKEPVGERLALVARKLVYGEPILDSGPTYEKMRVEGNKVFVTFANVGEGLMLRGGELSGEPVPAEILVGFTIAGADGHFSPAEARIIDKNTVELNSPSVAEPKAVRGGYTNFPLINLWSKNGLPLHPFRTDTSDQTMPVRAAAK